MSNNHIKSVRQKFVQNVAEKELALFVLCLIISCSSRDDCLIVHWSMFFIIGKKEGKSKEKIIKVLNFPYKRQGNTFFTIPSSGSRGQKNLTVKIQQSLHKACESFQPLSSWIDCLDLRHPPTNEKHTVGQSFSVCVRVCLRWSRSLSVPTCRMRLMRCLWGLSPSSLSSWRCG